MSIFFMSRDRGQYIRTEQEWKKLVSEIFPEMNTQIVSGVNRLGYICIIGNCFKSKREAEGSACMVDKLSSAGIPKEG
jgi:hypothetical protein